MTIPQDNAPQGLGGGITLLVEAGFTGVVIAATDGGKVIAGGSNGAALLPSIDELREGFSVLFINPSATGFDVIAQATDTINGTLGGTVAVASGSSATLAVATAPGTDKKLWWLA